LAESGYPGLIEELAHLRESSAPDPVTLAECRRAVADMLDSKLVDNVTHIRCYEFMLRKIISLQRGDFAFALHTDGTSTDLSDLVLPEMPEPRASRDRRQDLPVPADRAIVARAKGDRRVFVNTNLRSGIERRSGRAWPAFDRREKRSGNDRRKS